MVVITYGTFDLLHIGHLRILQRARTLGTRLVVGVSTEEFNLTKGKRTVVPFHERAELVQSLDVVDEVFPENSWDQKRQDIARFGADVFVMGSDWTGRFDDLADVVRVVYLARTDGVSTTIIRQRTGAMAPAWAASVG